MSDATIAKPWEEMDKMVPPLSARTHQPSSPEHEGSLTRIRTEAMFVRVFYLTERLVRRFCRHKAGMHAD